MSNYFSYHVVVFQSGLEEKYLITKDKEKKESPILHKQK